MSKRKGNKAEREACDIYERLDYRTFRPQESKFGETDIFGEFDLLAVPPAGALGKVILCQVKSNAARGVEAWSQAALSYQSRAVSTAMLVRHDGEPGPHTPGVRWRLLLPTSTATPPYRTVVDEREHDVGDGGDGVVNWYVKNTAAEVVSDGE